MLFFINEQSIMESVGLIGTEMMDEYLEYAALMSNVDLFAPGMGPAGNDDLRYCECGKLTADCAEAYSHLSRGY